MQELFPGWLWKLVFGTAFIFLLLAILYTFIAIVTVLTNGVHV